MDRDRLAAIATSCGAALRFGEPLSSHTTLRIGGPADFFLRPLAWEHLPDALEGLWDLGFPFRVLGGGSNLLVDDGPLGFGVLCLSQCKGGARWSGAEVEVDACFPLPALCAEAVRRGLSGLEGMGGIPGTVGGGLVMNAGAFGGELGRLVESVAMVKRGEGLKWYPASAFDFSYRRSAVAGMGVAAACRLKLTPSGPAEVRLRFDETRRKREATQPTKAATAGSVFKNPKGDHAGRLLEASGFKGMWKGQAAFSDLHANFLVNLGGATFEESRALCEEAREAVLAGGVALEYEMEIWRRLSAGLDGGGR